MHAVLSSNPRFNVNVNNRLSGLCRNLQIFKLLDIVVTVRKKALKW